MIQYGLTKTRKCCDSYWLTGTGAEKDIRRNTVGAEYRFTSGAIGGPSVASVNDQNLRNKIRGRSIGVSASY